MTISDPRKGDTVFAEDEQYKMLRADKVKTLKPVFQKDGGTITAANASALNDGASAIVLATQSKVDELSLKPLARIVAFADAAQAPIDFPTAPADAVKQAIARSGLSLDQISVFEFNEVRPSHVAAILIEAGLLLRRPRADQDPRPRPEEGQPARRRRRARPPDRLLRLAHRRHPHPPAQARAVRLRGHLQRRRRLDGADHRASVIPRTAMSVHHRLSPLPYRAGPTP